MSETGLFPIAPHEGEVLPPDTSELIAPCSFRDALLKDRLYAAFTEMADEGALASCFWKWLSDKEIRACFAAADADDRPLPYLGKIYAQCQSQRMVNRLDGRRP